LNWTRGLQLSSPESGPSTPRLVAVEMHAAAAVSGADTKSATSDSAESTFSDAGKCVCM